MLKFDIFNLLFTVINILILYAGFRKFLFGPVNKIIAKRQEEIEKGFAEAEEAKAEAQKVRDEQDGILAAANEEADRIVAGAKDKAKAEYTRILAAADKEAEAAVMKAKAEIEADKKRVMKDMESQIAGLVIAATEKIVGAKQDSEQDLLLYDQFLSEVGDSYGTDGN